MQIHREKDFLSCFDDRTGRYFRTGIIRDGRDTGEDPFMSSFPELVDVGIMGHCRHGKLGLCRAAGVECYQDGPHSDAPDMELDDFLELARQCSGRTYQFALGGCGDPDQHENFAEILQICRHYRIVPNYTTSGLGMTKDIAELSGRHCGAVAVSWYRSTYTLRAVSLLLNAGVKTNIHFVLARDSVAEAIRLLTGKGPSEGFPVGINAVVFLLHKPVGLGSREKVISLEDESFKEFLKLVNSRTFRYRVGFDSCTVPALVNNPGIIDMKSLDTCEGARWSAYVTPDMKMLPCSFDNQDRRWEVNLRDNTVEAAWNSSTFEDFRTCLRTSCPECDKRSLCMGGCPVRPEIVLCGRRLDFQRQIDNPGTTGKSSVGK